MNLEENNDEWEFNVLTTNDVVVNEKKRKKKKKKKENQKKKKTYKSDQEEEGDEVDIIRGSDPSQDNTNNNNKTLSLDLTTQIQDEYTCLTAKTALLLPFKWSEPTKADLGQWNNEMLKRTVVDVNGETLDLYEQSKRLPDAVADLDPHFRKSLGWNETKNSDDDDDDDEFMPFDDGPDLQADEVCSRVVVRREAMKVLIPSPGLVANQADKKVYQRVRIEEIEIIGFPLGTAVLKIVLNWIPNPKESLTLDDLRTWVYLSKFRHKVEAFDGWLLNTEAKSEPDHNIVFCGTRLWNSLYCKQAASLSSIGNYLLMASDENPEHPPQRLGRFAKRCYHHTIVVIDKKPTPTLLREYLFHLKRAYGQKNRPPPLTVKEEKTTTDTDRILRPRSNRYIGMSREGTVSLSWPSRDKGDDYEIRKWSQAFLGIYLLLATHVQGEKAILLDLSNLSAHAGSLIKRISWNPTYEKEALQEMIKLRAELGSLAALMTRYTLQMSSDDCGGLSEYVEFFTSLRIIFGIRNQRSELRDEIQDVLSLVESSYLEEQRKFAEISTYYRKNEKHQSKKRDEQIAANQARFQNTFAVVSIFSIPLMILGGLFGMNLTDLPVEVPFYPALLATLSCSGVLLIAFGLFVHFTKAHPQPLSPDPSATGPRLSFSLELERPPFP